MNRIERFKRTWSVPVLEKNSSIIVCLIVLYFCELGDIIILSFDLSSLWYQVPEIEKFA